MNPLLEGCKLKKEKYTLPNGKKLTLSELTAGQRGRLIDIDKEDPAKGQAIVVVMGCDNLTDDDIEGLLELPGGVIIEMADKVMELSGLGDKEDVKND